MLTARRQHGAYFGNKCAYAESLWVSVNGGEQGRSSLGEVQTDLRAALNEPGTSAIGKRRQFKPSRSAVRNPNMCLIYICLGSENKLGVCTSQTSQFNSNEVVRPSRRLSCTTRIIILMPTKDPSYRLARTTNNVNRPMTGYVPVICRRFGKPATAPSIFKRQLESI